MDVLKNLKPQKVFEYFERLCSVPHGSGNTKQISDLCLGFAKELGLECRQDELNNLVIRKRASEGYENAETVILQAHMDMVCAKTDDCTKDMAAEGLDVMTDGAYVWADKTSLGGDDCIGVAIVFAVLADDTLPHPPLEAVLTVDEETGMLGAIGLDCSDLRGRKLINLDSEDEDVFTVSCAGGVTAECLLPRDSESVGEDTVYRLSIYGLLGGHSGVDIDKGRGNANVLMGRTLYTAMETVGPVRLCGIEGGSFDNAICNRCDATVAISADRAQDFERFIAEYDKLLKNEYAVSDAGLTLGIERSTAESAVSQRLSRNMLFSLFAIPNGLQELSPELAGLVQTSLNCGVARMDNDGLHLRYCIRSSIDSQKISLFNKLCAIVELSGGRVEASGEYPGWQYTKHSALRELLLDSYREVSGKEGKLLAIHAGLECGLFTSKLPGLDTICIGPNIYNIHTVNERLDVASTERIYSLVCQILKKCK